MGNYSKYRYVNTAFGGTGGMVVPNGTTAERDAGVAVGTLRYNTDLGLIEQYNALGWQSVDAPPTVTNISGTINENTNSTITIVGSNFKTGAIVSVEGAAVGGIPRALSTTFVSTTQLTAATNAASVNYVGGAGFDIKVGNPSGLGGTLSNAGTIDRDPVWSTGSGTYTVYDGSRSQTLSFVAADPDSSQTITYSVLSGSLPAGASLNTSTGAITGFSAVSSDTSSPFTLRATSSFNSQTSDRNFTILVKAPVVQSFTSTGSSTFSVPTGVTAVEVLVVAGGGAGGNQHGGGGGAGGLIFRPGFPVTPGGSIPVNVGAGGTGMPAGGSNSYWSPEATGKDSNFGTLVAKGGGIGPSHSGAGGGQPGQPGGNGGGGNSDPSGVPPGGTGTQPSQPGDSGTYGFGNPGGNGLPGPGYPNWVGGGGGGAGAAGGGAPGPHAGNGGVGRAYSISGSSVFYAGGGGGGQHGGGVDGNNGVGGNGGGGPGNRTAHNSTNNFPGPRGSGGTANRGGGGGGSASGGVTVTDPGGSGIVIVKY
jgi:hypothetical protein